MSRNLTSAAGNQNAEPALTPKLRFPEFRDAGGWTSKPMSTVYSFKGNNSLSRDKLNYERGTVKNIHYGDIHTKFATHFDITTELVPFINPSESLASFKADNFCVEGDMIFADASEDLADIGKAIEIVRLNRERVVSGLHTILARQNEDELFLGFGGHLFKSKWVRTQIQKESQGSKVLGLSGGRLAKIEVPFPSPAEQQKIAECLTSLDEVIAAQRQKLDALKTHKKGLMQQLFPREGETLPRLRFPEFQKGSGWKLKKIGALLVDTPRRIEMDDENQYSLVTVKRRYGGVVSREILKGKNIKVKSQFIVEANDFLISKRQIVHNACGLVPDELEGCIVSNEYSVLTPREGCDVSFFNYFVQQPSVSHSFMRASVGIVIEKMLFKLDSWLKREFLFPSFEEQKRIATCLTTLDDLITAHSAKLSALKTHKRGLMQQLFPSPEEVEA